MIILVLIVLGLAFGSFINALVWRIHVQDKLKSKKARQAYSISKGRSMCTTCRHELAAKDLVPIVSWILLKGRCRYCKAPIADTPAPELITPGLFVLSYLNWPVSFDTEGITIFVFWLIFLVGFVALALYDLKWFLLPNRIVFPLLALAALQVLVQIAFSRDIDPLINALWGLLVGGGIFWVLFQLSDGKWIGGGDVKLGWLLGLILGGPAMSLLMIFLASLIGTFVSVPLLVLKKAHAKTHLPFGPFLIVATVLVQLFGAGIIGWYKHQIGLN